MALKIRQFDGDGQQHQGTFELPVRDPQSGEVLEDVVLVCQIVTKAQAREYYRKHTTKKLDPTTRHMVEHVDAQAAVDALLSDIIVDWRGVVGFDDEPLLCSAETVAALDDRIKAQVMDAVLGGEVTGHGPETFRSAPAVPHVVAG